MTAGPRAARAAGGRRRSLASSVRRVHPGPSRLMLRLGCSPRSPIKKLTNTPWPFKRWMPPSGAGPPRIPASSWQPQVTNGVSEGPAPCLPSLGTPPSALHPLPRGTWAQGAALQPASLPSPVRGPRRVSSGLGNSLRAVFLGGLPCLPYSTPTLIHPHLFILATNIHGASRELQALC